MLSELPMAEETGTWYALHPTTKEWLCKDGKWRLNLLFGTHKTNTRSFTRQNQAQKAAEKYSPNRDTHIIMVGKNQEIAGAGRITEIINYDASGTVVVKEAVPGGRIKYVAVPPAMTVIRTHK